MQTKDSIGLFGGWSGIHVGDDAILLESLRAIEEEAPHRKVQLFCSTPEVTKRLVKNTDKVQVSPAFRCFIQEETHQLLSSKSPLEKIYYRANWIYKAAQLFKQCSKVPNNLDTLNPDLAAFVKALQQCKILIFSGGGYLNSHLRLSWLYPSLILIALCRKLEIPVYLCGQTVGPLDSAKDKWLVGKVFRHVSLIGTREDKSITLLKELGINPSLLVREKDAAWGLNVNPSIQGANDRASTDSEKIGISLQPRGEAEQAFDQELVTKILESFPGINLLFFPHAPEDVPYQEAILNKLTALNQELTKRASIVPFDLPPDKNKELMRSCKICIGTRFHFHVFALSTATPSISIYKQLKTSGIFKDYQIENLCFDPQSLNEPVTQTLQTVVHTLEKSEQYRNLLAKCIADDTFLSHVVLRRAIRDLEAAIS